MSLCFVGIVTELGMRAMGSQEDSEGLPLNAWEMGAFVIKGCVEGMIALSVLRLAMAGLNIATRWGA